MAIISDIDIRKFRRPKQVYRPPQPTRPPAGSPAASYQPPRRIQKDDDIRTLPNRVTFPVGSYVSNPSTALDGALGTAGGTLPPRPQTQQQFMMQQRNSQGIPIGPGTQPAPNSTAAYYGSYGSYGPLAGSSGSYGTQTGNNQPGQTQTQPPRPGNQPKRDTRPEPYLYQKTLLSGMEFMNKLPTSVTNVDLMYFNQQGLDTSQLAQFYVYDAKTGTYKLNQQGQTLNQTAGPNTQQQLKPGQYRDPVSGEVKYGTTPFGVNAAGQRLDASGNVWNPATATTDIYGGKFIQVGEVRWERNQNGRLVKVQYGPGGKKTVVAGGSGQSKNRGGGVERQTYDTTGGYGQPAQYEEKAAPGYVTGSRNINFNTGVG